MCSSAYVAEIDVRGRNGKARAVIRDRRIKGVIAARIKVAKVDGDAVFFTGTVLQAIAASATTAATATAAKATHAVAHVSKGAALLCAGKNRQQ